jgi:hypothetical protein
MVVEEIVPDSEELVEDERLEEDEAWDVMDLVVELFRTTGLWEVVDIAAGCKLVEGEIELF